MVQEDPTAVQLLLYSGHGEEADRLAVSSHQKRGARGVGLESALRAVPPAL